MRIDRQQQFTRELPKMPLKARIFCAYSEFTITSLISILNTYLWQLCRRIHRNVASVTWKFDYDGIRFVVVLYHLRLLLFRSFSVARIISNFWFLFLVSVFNYRIRVTFRLFCLIWTKIIATWFAGFTASWRTSMFRTFMIFFLRFS